MFSTVYDGKEYDVNFSYPNPRETYCEILDQEVVVAFGQVKCSPEDQFEKNRGRKFAMGRALNGLIPRSDGVGRSYFWQAYFEARHGKF